jgi:hypothetical protein
MQTGILVWAFLENVHFEDLAGDGRIMFEWILGRWVIRMASEWSWLKLMYVGRLWY